MDTNVNVKRKFKIDGEEYDSLEDIPVELRAAVQKALTTRQRPGPAPRPAAAPARITVNGREYESVEAMPPAIRMLYEGALKTAETEARSQAAAPSPTHPIPGSTKSGRPFFLRALIALVLLAIVILLFRILD
ncbi:MAG: hypothetical protein ACYDH3_02015 [Candidatus Aminicenantales bacterium]